MPLRRNADSVGSRTLLKADAKLDTFAEHRCDRRRQNDIPLPTWRRQLQFVVGHERRQTQAVVSTVQSVGIERGVFDAHSSFQVAVALEEAISNAVIHGNLEVSSDLREEDDGSYERLIAMRSTQTPYRDRRVTIEAHFTECEVVFVISDEGPGFDTARQSDPTDLNNLLRPFGRGQLLMRQMVDEVYYNAQGNQVTLIKRLQTADAVPPFPRLNEH